MDICYIIGAGQLPLLYINRKNSLVIAADGGLEKLGKEIPDIIVGDFDSLGFIPNGENVITLPIKKDITDMQYAVTLGIEKGCNMFVLYGGTGGRPDHTFANYALLCSLAQKGLKGYLVGDGYIVTAVYNSTVKLPDKRRGTVSVFSAENLSKGVTIKGLEYTLDNAQLDFINPLGVSNSFVGQDSEITVKDGTLLIMWEEKNLKEFIDNLYS